LTIREKLEEIERSNLSPYAKLSAESRGRLLPEKECELRPCFQHDRDRIIHSKAFRRLKHKTQVFLSPTGDHYRTRLTHTLEVSQIARTIAKSLNLNCDLTEAIALGHDLGHTPFGHAGEHVLNEIFPGGFFHNEQSLRVVEVLERNGKGLNLTHEVREGILMHSKGMGNILRRDPDKIPSTLEGQVARVADIIAYVCHDLDDAIRGGVIRDSDIPKECCRVLGHNNSQRIGNMVKDVVYSTLSNNMLLHISDDVLNAMIELRRFLYNRVYTIPEIHDNFLRSKKIISELYQRLLEDDALFETEIGELKADIPRERMVCDFIAGMTDRYALNLYDKIFLPRPWVVL
jgi:dGTPase